MIPARPPARKMAQEEPVPEGEIHSLFDCKVVPQEAHRASEIRFWSFARPHMRTFHLCYIALFLAFVNWFCLPPLLPTIQDELHLATFTTQVANIASLCMTIFVRSVAGKCADWYGPRRTLAVVLAISAIPVLFVPMIRGGQSYILVKCFIGFVGGAFVICQFWTSSTFAKNIVGTANAVTAGWGNLGAAGALLIVGNIQALYQAVGAPASTAWRCAPMLTALLMPVVAYFVWTASDDNPTTFLESHLATNANSSTKLAVKDEEESKIENEQKVIALNAVNSTGWRLWASTLLLVFAYALCFGTEVHVNNNVTSYYYNNFNRPNCHPPKNKKHACAILDQSLSNVVGACYPLVNLFARATGGFTSDKIFRRWGLNGRICFLTCMLMMQGLLLIAWSKATALGPSIFSLVIFGIVTDASCGATYAIVPVVNEALKGTVSGFVGAGGNVGALLWAVLFIYQAGGGATEFAIAFRHIGYIIVSFAPVVLLLSFTIARGPPKSTKAALDTSEHTVQVGVDDDTRHSQVSIQTA